VTASNVYRASRLRLLITSGALLVGGLIAAALSVLPSDRFIGLVMACLGALGLLFHKVRPPPELRIEQDALVVNGRPVPWADVDVSELREGRRGALRFPKFEVMVKDPKSDTGRSTIEVLQPKWRRFDELFDALCSFKPKR